MRTGATLRLRPHGLKQYPNLTFSNVFAHDARLSFQDEKLDATSRSLRLAALSSSIRSRGSAASDEPPCECLFVRLLHTAWPLTCQRRLPRLLFWSLDCFTAQCSDFKKSNKYNYRCWVKDLIVRVLLLLSYIQNIFCLRHQVVAPPPLTVVPSTRDCKY